MPGTGILVPMENKTHSSQHDNTAIEITTTFLSASEFMATSDTDKEQRTSGSTAFWRTYLLSPSRKHQTGL
jgi:hypothetical protein